MFTVNQRIIITL